MRHNIDLNIIQLKDGKDTMYTMQGRLLGVATTLEVSKITRNWEVSTRVYTGETKRVRTVLSFLDREYQDRLAGNLGHVVVALSSIGREKVSQILSKQMFISPPITLVTEEGKDAETNLTSVVMECGGNTMLTIEENKHV